MNEPAPNLTAIDGADLLSTSLAGGVLTITLGRPPAHALSMDMLKALIAELTRAADDGAVRVIVIASTGRIFCAGHNLKDIQAHRADGDGGRAYFEELFEACSEMMMKIVRHPNPVIAAVSGIATAAGCQLVASCDLAIASDKSQFATPGVNLGGFCTTPTVALSRNLSRKHMIEMLLTGEMIDAHTARDFGLVNRVVPAEYLDQVVTKYATAIASRSAGAIARGKRAYYRQLELPLDEAYAYASKVMVEGFLTNDAQEGVSAFFEKRDPRWTDR